MRARIRRARELERRRFEGTGLITNSEMGPVEVWDFCHVEESATHLLGLWLHHEELARLSGQIFETLFAAGKPL